MKRCWLIIVLFSFIGLSSCKKQAPQLPSNKIVIDNSDAEALLDINQNLAKQEDSLLNILVKKKYTEFVKNEIGFWYKIEQKGNGLKIKDKATCNFSYKLQLMNGKLIETGRKKIVIGKKQAVVGLEEGIKLLSHGDSATIIIPWYLGFGMKGNKPQIPPYTSIIYQIRIDN